VSAKRHFFTHQVANRTLFVDPMDEEEDPVQLTVLSIVIVGFFILDITIRQVVTQKNPKRKLTPNPLSISRCARM